MRGGRAREEAPGRKSQGGRARDEETAVASNTIDKSCHSDHDGHPGPWCSNLVDTSTTERERDPQNQRIQQALVPQSSRTCGILCCAIRPSSQRGGANMSQRCRIEGRRDTMQSFCHDMTRYADPIAHHHHLELRAGCSSTSCSTERRPEHVANKADVVMVLVDHIRHT